MRVRCRRHRRSLRRDLALPGRAAAAARRGGGSEGIRPTVDLHRLACDRPFAGGHRAGTEGAREPPELPAGRVRRPGGGRKPLTTKDPGLVHALERLVAPVTRGDPESPLRWTAKSLRRLSAELAESGHPVEPADGVGTARRGGLQPPGEREDHRGSPASGPGCPVPVHQRPRPRADGSSTAGHLGGHEEEGAWSATSRTAGASVSRRARPKMSESTTSWTRISGRSIPYGVYDIDAQRGLGERRHRPRHRRLRRGLRTSLVGNDGPRGVPRCEHAADHGRRRREQRLPASPVEDRAAEARGRAGPRDHRVPPSRRARASGTRSSTASSRSSPRTGEEGRS